MLPILAPFCELPCVVGPSQILVVLKKNCVTNWENSHDVDFYPGESSMKRNEPIIQVETMINMEDLKQLIWFIWKKKFFFVHESLMNLLMLWVTETYFLLL